MPAMQTDTLFTIGGFALALEAAKLAGGWLTNYFGIDAKRQDTDRSHLRSQILAVETKLNTELSSLHERVSREADKRATADAALLEKIHTTQISIAGNYVTKGELAASEGRIIAAIHERGQGAKS